MLDKIKKEGADLRNEFRKRAAGYVIAAFGLVAGLAWNEAIKALIEDFFPRGENSLWAKFSYALIITVLLVLVTVYINKIISKEESKEEIIEE